MTRPRARLVNGLLLLDKPLGLTSNVAVQKVKRLYQAQKAGHTGTLDPLAGGLLPICLGEAAKFSHALLDADKTYEALIQLGQTTTTGDAEGEIVETRPVAVSRARAEAALARFAGTISQTPPMHSALKHRGKPLYAYARAGIEVARQAREITIHSLRLDSLDGDKLHITVACGKGTYIRTLAEDIGKALDCGAHLKGLRRTAVGGLDLSGAVTLARLEGMDPAQRDALLLPVDRLLQTLPEAVLEEEAARRLLHGQAVFHAAPLSGPVRLYDPGRRFLGVGEVAEGKIIPKRLLAAPPPPAE